MGQRIFDQFIGAFQWQASAYNQVHEMIWHVCDQPRQVSANG